MFAKLATAAAILAALANAKNAAGGEILNKKSMSRYTRVPCLIIPTHKQFMIIFSNLDSSHDKALEQHELDWILTSISFTSKWVGKQVQDKMAEIVADADDDFDGNYTVKETQHAFFGMLREVNRETKACEKGKKKFDLSASMINHFKLTMKSYGDLKGDKNTVNLANRKTATEDELKAAKKPPVTSNRAGVSHPPNPTKCKGLSPNFNAALDTRSLWKAYVRNQKCHRSESDARKAIRNKAVKAWFANVRNKAATKKALAKAQAWNDKMHNNAKTTGLGLFFFERIVKKRRMAVTSANANLDKAMKAQLAGHAKANAAVQGSLTTQTKENGRLRLRNSNAQAARRAAIKASEKAIKNAKKAQRVYAAAKSRFGSAKTSLAKAKAAHEAASRANSRSKAASI